MSEIKDRAADDRTSQLQKLIARGKEQGFLTYLEVNDHLPSEIVDPEQIEEIVNIINDMGIPVYEKAPDAESLSLNDATVTTDDEAIEEAAAAIATVDDELDQSTDPIDIYIREMAAVELLTREGEIRLAKIIEEGHGIVCSALARFPGTYTLVLRAYESAKAGQTPLIEVITGFVDVDASAEFDQPQTLKPRATATDEEDDNQDERDYAGSNDETIELGPDPDEAAQRFGFIQALHTAYMTIERKFGFAALPK